MEHPIVQLNHSKSYLSQIMYELRDKNIQQDRSRFRRNLSKLGNILAYEISKNLPYKTLNIDTQLGSLAVEVLEEQPLVVSILRAGLPLHNGFLDMWDHADSGFISAYRHHTKGNEFIIKLEYMAVPEITGRDIVLLDPMIATGSSILLCYNALLKLGEPRSVYIASVIASEEGIENVQRHLPNAKIFVIDIDYELTARSCIVPGLGDAGDLCFGEKNSL